MCYNNSNSTNMEKTDLTKTRKKYYSAKSKPEITSVEPATFLSIAGTGDPSGKAFADRIQALYTTAYTLKFKAKSRNQDFVVARLEGLWWFDEKKHPGLSITESAIKVPRKEWEYRLLIRMPEFVNGDDVMEAKRIALSKNKTELVNDVEIYEMNEGKCVQMLHVGPFSTEPESLEKIHRFTEGNNLSKNGLHHEIYLSDFRRTPQEKLRTILREPVK